MAIVKPFKGIRPPKELVEKVQSRPYDVLNSEEARTEAAGNEMSLYHISRGAQAAIACIVSLANVCTANNTIAIITTGRIAHDVAQKFGISAKKTASLMDTFSCLVQSMIPYGAQLLMAAGLASISSSSIIPYLYYPFLMGLCAIVSIAFSRR